MSEAPRILVVEDNPVTRKMLRVTLEAEGYRVVEATDLRSALSAAKTGLPDLVLQDLILPDGDGTELAARLRELPGGAEVPIVALTGFASRIEADGTLAECFNAVLLKPIEPARLVEAIRPLLVVERADVAQPGRGSTLLIVDDDAVQLKLIRIHLVQLGYKVMVASNASEALRVARQRLPELIVSDVLMPEVDGFQLCFEVRRDPELRRIPVVLLSAHYRADADTELSQRVGANELVMRTPMLEGLGPAISRALESGAPAASAEPSERVQLEHARAVIRQLDRQLALTEGLTRRSALLAAQLALLGGIADALTRRSEIQAVLRDVLAATLDAAAISKGALFLKADDGNLSIEHTIGFSLGEEASLRRFFGQPELLEQAIAQRVPVSIPSPGIDERVTTSILAAANAVTAEIVPLVSAERTHGAIVLAARHTDLTSEDAVIFARAIGSQVVQALELDDSFAKLTASELRYRTLMEHASDAIAILTPQGIIRETNRRTETTLGLSRGQMIGRHIADFSAPGAETDNVQSYSRTVAAGSGRTPPVAIRRSDGSVVLMEFSNTSIDLAGEPLVLAIGRDVTEQVRANAQLIASDRMACIGTMAAGVAHEINNPLAAISANLDLAVREVADLRQNLDQANPNELEEEIRDAREAADRVREIVRDLKIFSRSADERREPVDVHRVLDSSLRIAWNEIRHRAQLVKDYGDIPQVLADDSRLGQVFLNLAVNAAQAIEEGHADANELRVRTRRDGAEVVVEVADTGSGMSEETLRKLFTPFFTTKPVGFGTGLGLPICERIVSGFGGRIEVSSELGKGSTFRVRLPAIFDRQASARPTTGVPASRKVRRATVLVIDDDPLVGTAVRRTLKAEHDVTVVSSAGAALARIAAGERFDVLLCDLMMPVLSGMDLHGKLLTVAPDQAGCMIFLTGGAFTPAARAFLDGVENPVLEKPFDLNTLRALVAERLR